MHKPHSTLFFLAMTLCAALSLLMTANAVFADDTAKAPADGNTAVPEEQTAATKEKGIQLIPFKGYDLDGKPLNLGDRIGKKPVLLVFWASWCPSCKAEVPKVNELARQYASRGMDFIGINIGENDTYKRAKLWASKHGVSYPNYFDATGMVSQMYRLQGVPTVVVADSKGYIRFYGHDVPEISEDIFQKLTAN